MCFLYLRSRFVTGLSNEFLPNHVYVEFVMVYWIKTTFYNPLLHNYLSGSTVKSFHFDHAFIN